MAENNTETPTSGQPTGSGSFGTWAALAALAAIALLGLLMCPGDDPDPDAAQKAAAAPGVAALEGGSSPADSAGEAGGAAADAAPGEGAPGEEDPADGASPAAADGASNAAGQAEAGAQGEPEAGAEDGAEAEPAAGAEGDEVADDPAAAGADDANADVVQIEDEANADATPSETADDGTPSPGTAPAPPPDADRAKESTMSGEELYAAAKLAYDAGNYREAYRLATRSYRAEKATRTQELRGRAACRIKDRDAAKAIVKSFKLRDPKRKELRNFCKEHGVSVGI